jgi:hypothetical protein
VSNAACNTACATPRKSDARLRHRQERLHDERQAKKEALERQREAAKRAAVMHLPVQQKDAASGDSIAKLYARPPAAGAAASAAKPVEGGSKALPRLKQAMEVRLSAPIRLRAPSFSHAAAYLQPGPAYNLFDKCVCNARLLLNQARAQLTEANRRNLELAHKEKVRWHNLLTARRVSVHFRLSASNAPMPNRTSILQR